MAFIHPWRTLRWTKKEPELKKGRCQKKALRKKKKNPNNERGGGTDCRSKRGVLRELRCSEKFFLVKRTTHFWVEVPVLTLLGVSPQNVEEAYKWLGGQHLTSEGSLKVK